MLDITFNFIIFLYIGLATILARIFGEIFEKINLSSIFGELLSGFLLGGPIFFLAGLDEGFHIGDNFTFDFHEMAEAIEPFAQIGILMLLFIVGSEIKISELRKAGKRNIFISLIDVSITYSLGFLMGYFVVGGIFGERNLGVAAFFGLIFVPTSIGTTVRTLGNIKKLNTKEGQTLLSLAVFDDFLALLLLLIVSGIVFSGTSGTGIDLLLNVLIQIGLIILFAVIILYLLPKFIDFIENRFRIFSLASTSYFFIGIVFGILLIMSYFSEFLGISAAIGAFLLGIGMQKNKVLMNEPLESFIKIGDGVFVPLFFFSIGSSFILEEFNYLYMILIPIAILSKMIGSFTGAMFSTNPLKGRLLSSIRKSLNGNESTQLEKAERKASKVDEPWIKSIKPNIVSSSKIAIGMMPKGEITLIIAAIGLSEVVRYPQEIQTLANDLYYVAVLIVLVTVFLTPFLLRLAFRTPKSDEEKAALKKKRNLQKIERKSEKSKIKEESDVENEN